MSENYFYILRSTGRYLSPLSFIVFDTKMILVIIDVLLME